MPIGLLKVVGTLIGGLDRSCENALSTSLLVFPQTLKISNCDDGAETRQ